MAFEMARKGMNVLLISRTETKLVDAEAELKAACPSVAVEHLAIDYSNFDASLQVSDTGQNMFVLILSGPFQSSLSNFAHHANTDLYVPGGVFFPAGLEFCSYVYKCLVLSYPARSSTTP